MPLLDRNRLLLAARFAPRYAERPLDDDALSAARDAVRVARQLALAPDPGLTAIYEELPAPGAGDTEGPRIEADVVLPMIISIGGRELRLFSTITTFGTPMDLTLDEVAIESYYPADAESAAYFTA